MRARGAMVGDSAAVVHQTDRGYGYSDAARGVMMKCRARREEDPSDEVDYNRPWQPRTTPRLAGEMSANA